MDIMLPHCYFIVFLMINTNINKHNYKAYGIQSHREFRKFKKRLLELADPANNYVDGVEGKSYGDKNPKKGAPVPTNIADPKYDVTSLNYSEGVRMRK